MTLMLTAPGWAASAEKPSKAAGPYNKAVVAFCERNLDKKIGSGECSHLAHEALRVAGAHFMFETSKRGDYVWGTLVKQVTWEGGQGVDSSPKAKCQPGDVVQLRSAEFSFGKSGARHTAVIAVVDDSGRPTAIYEQNGSPDKRYVTKRTVDFTNLTGGWYAIYRPSKPRPDPRNPVEFSLLNHTDKPITYTFGKQPWKIDAYDTLGGYRVWRSVPSALVVGRSTITPKHRKAYEIYKTRNGQVAVRELK
jgi:hypothetical protein